MIHLRSLLTDIFTSSGTTVRRTPSGVDISMYDTSDERSLTVSAVYTAIKLISEGVARLTLSLQRYNEARKCFVDYVDDALYAVLRVCPNNYP